MELEATLAWTPLVSTLAAAFSIDPALVLAIIYVESRGDALAYNRTSMATGLMGIMPRGAGEMFQDRPTRRELHSPGTNILWGLRILHSHLIAPGGTIWSAVYSYTGGDVWDSREDFVEKYWLPLTEAWARIELELCQREKKE